MNGMEKRMDDVHDQISRLDAQVGGIEKQMEDLHASSALSEQHIMKQLGVISNMQSVAMDRWSKSTAMMEHIEMMLDEKESERVAVDAQLIDHKTRISTLEKRTA